MVCTEPVLHVFCSTHYKPELSFNRPTECDLFCSPVLNIYEIKCNRSTRHSLRLSISNRMLSYFSLRNSVVLPFHLYLFRYSWETCSDAAHKQFSSSSSSLYGSLSFNLWMWFSMLLFFANVHFFDRFQPKSECVCVHAFLSCYNINDPVLSDDIRKTKTQPVCIEHCSARTHTHTEKCCCTCFISNKIITAFNTIIILIKFIIEIYFSLLRRFVVSRRLCIYIDFLHLHRFYLFSHHFFFVSCFRV